MTQAGGYQVDPAELQKFASYLSSTTHNDIQSASGAVSDANGFDNSAFGILLAQILAVPARIAMGVVSGKLKDLASEIDQASQDTVSTAKNYQDNEQTVSTSFNSIPVQEKAS
ncbi:MAG TPA: hypothetical protein VF444_19980 [Pseudonocardiaceae bacterium]